jgi:mono/diheme cytochrome c family protein
MSHVFSLPSLALAAVVGLTAQPVLAETPGQILASIESSARAMPGYQAFSAARGEQFFKAKHGNDWSCSSCHTDNPATLGKHAKTGKPIQPLAPSANAERFTDPAKVEKWFKRNCNDVLGRVCSPQERGDVLSYLLTVKK